MNNDLLNSAETIGMFCRLKMNAKSDSGIRSSEMGVLIFVQKQDKAVTPSMVSEFFKITKPSVTSMVNALVDKGFLEKSSSLKDRRSYTLLLTEAGRALLDAAFNDYIKSVQVLKEEMGEIKFNDFIALMDTANTILEKTE